MRDYPDQPKEPVKLEMDKIKVIIEKVLNDDLPDCATNDWFIDSVYYANMIDKIMEKIWLGV